MCAAYFHQTHPQQTHPNQDQKMPQVAQQLANVVTSSTQYRMNGVTQLAFEPITLQFPIRLHVTNGGFPVCQPKHEPTDFEITYKSGCLGERNAKANHSS